MKDLITIYENNEQKIELHQNFFDAYDQLLTPFYRASAFVYDFILGLAAETIVDKGIACPNDMIVCSRKIYILEENEPIRLEKNFQVFEDTLRDIVSTIDFPQHIADNEEQINNEGKFFCEIFDANFLDVQGYLCQVENGTIKLLFFTYDK